MLFPGRLFRFDARPGSYPCQRRPFPGAALAAESLTGIPNPRTRDGTWVTDMAGALRPETITRLNTTIGELERSNTAEMTVVVIKSLDGLAIEEAAVKLFEPGASARSTRTTACCFSGRRATGAFASKWDTDSRGRCPTERSAPSSTPTSSRNSKPGISTKACSLASMRWSVWRAPSRLNCRRRRASRDEGTSGGLASLLAGISGTIVAVIGSIVGVRRWRRYGRRRCPECDAWMTRLAETEDDALLAAGQQAEERVGSVDYDVWKCGVRARTTSLSATRNGSRVREVSAVPQPD